MSESKTKTMDERLHPDLVQACTIMPSLDICGDIDLTRERIDKMFVAATPDPETEMTVLNVPGLPGNPDVPVRIFKPVRQNGALPGLLYIHGGGYILGFAAMSDDLCQKMAQEAKCIVVSVDYRLAPEYPYPAGLEDCYAALLWMADPNNGYPLDRSCLAVAGGSAGGGLTAALALLARDKGGPALQFQMPLFPMIDDRNTTPSSYELTDSRFWNRDTNIKAWEMYVGGQTAEHLPYAAPARVVNLSGLPPVYTCVGELDLFRDETIEYVARLMQAGVSTEFHVYPGCFHGFENFVPQAPISIRANADFMNYLVSAFDKCSPNRTYSALKPLPCKNKKD